MSSRGRRDEAFAAVVALTLSLLLVACRSPTEITVKVETDVCASVTSTAFTSGELASLAVNTPTSVSSTCSDGHIGTVVLIPSDADNAEVGFKVITALRGETIDRCTSALAANDPNCIVARRDLRYLPHTPLTVIVDMLSDCAGFICDPSSTCVNRACVSATIADPSQCEGAGCQSEVLGPPVQDGGTADATLPGDAAPPEDAALEGGATDAPLTDAPVNVGDGALPVVLGCDLGGLMPGSPWPMESYCPSARNRSPLVGPTSAPTHKWTYSPGGFVTAPSVGPDGRLYLGTYSGNVVSLDPAHGTVLWSSGGVKSVYAVLPALGADGTLRVFDFANATYQSFALDGAAGSPHAVGASRGGVTPVGNGTMYFPSNEGAIIALNGDGTQQWAVTGDSYDEVLPSVAHDGTIYSADNGTGVYAINPDGGAKWSATLDSGMVEDVTVAVDGTLRTYTTQTGRIYALDPVDGGVLWSAIGDSNGVQGMAITDDNTMIVSGSQVISAWDSTGKMIASSGDGCTEATIDQAGNIYSICDNGQLTMFDDQLHLRWQVPIPSYLGAPADGVILGPNGMVYAVTTGSLDAAASNADTTAIDAFGP